MPVRKKETSKCRILTVYLLVFLILATGVIEGSRIDIWDSFKGDERNTGLSPYGTSDYNGEIKWDFDTGRSISASPVLGSRGEIYVGSVSGEFFSISSSGLERWSYNTGDSIRSTAAIGNDGLIYVGSDDGILYAFKSYGEVEWRYQTGGAINSSPAVGDDGTVYVGSNDGHLYSFSPDGSLIWKYDTGGRISSSPAIGEGAIYIGKNRATFHDHVSLIAVNTDGDRIWNYTVEGNINSALMVDDNGYIYAGARGGKLYSFYTDGKLRWTFDTDSRINSSPSIDGEGNIYLTAMDSKIYSIDINGDLRWSYGTGRYITSSPSICSDGYLFFGSSDGKFYSLTRDGDERVIVDIGESIISTAAIGRDGTVYFGGVDGRVYALNGVEEVEYRPPTPISLTAEAGERYVEINWNMPEHEREINSFNLYRKQERDDRSYLFSVPSSKTSFKDTSIESGETYHYSVSAVDSDGESIATEPVTVIIPERTEKEEESLFYRRKTIMLLTFLTLVLVISLCSVLKKRRELKNISAFDKDVLRTRYTCPFCGNIIHIREEEHNDINCTRCKSTIKAGVFN